ncbi:MULTISPECIES: hypothetical protein [Tenacibaculum]|uniref:hypothetical protein n=1 Tax=Tenacibaculum TaxID=104267 RepID=UPI0032C45BF6|nr:hypothetical protein BACT7_27690 [Tenacibaculum mesophilum]BFF41309.1 hypothetical protein BACY1_31140 [Tenacibaculum mesophilum]
MGNPVNVNGVTLTLKDFRKFDTNINSENVPKGPLVNMSGLEGSTSNLFTVTVLAYLPDNPLKPIENTTGLQLQGNEIYLNYYGISPIKILNKDGGYTTVSGRDFRVDFNCKKEASHFDLYYLQFTYQLEAGTELADMIYVRDNNTTPILGDVNNDPELERGTVTAPATPPPPTMPTK